MNQIVQLAVVLSLTLGFLSQTPAWSQTENSSPIDFETLVGSCASGATLRFTAEATETKTHFVQEARPSASSSQVLAPMTREYKISLSHNARRGAITVRKIEDRPVSVPNTVAVKVRETRQAKQNLQCNALQGLTGSDFKKFSESLINGERGERPSSTVTPLTTTLRFDQVARFDSFRKASGYNAATREYNSTQSGDFAGVRTFCGNNPKAAFTLTCELRKTEWSVSMGQGSTIPFKTNSTRSVEGKIEGWAFYIPAEIWESPNSENTFDIPTLSESVTHSRVSFEKNERITCKEIMTTSDQDFADMCEREQGKWKVLSTQVKSAPEMRATLSPRVVD